SRVRAFQPRDMIVFLDVAVGLNPDRGPDDRQRTLYQAIAWSYRLLNAEQQALLRRLTVFAGSFTLDAAVQVAADHELEGADVVRLLPELIDHSLVEVRRSGSSTRYRILEAIRTFAAFDDSDRGLFADRHSGYFAKLVAEAESQLRGPGQHRWLQFLDDDIDNLRLALANSLASGNVETAWGLIEGSVMFWEYSGRRWEGVEWVRKAFAADTGAVSRTIARGQAAAAWMLTSHDTHETRSAAEKAMATADAVGDSVAYQRARVALGWTLAHYRRAEAAAMLAEAASFFASQGERWWQSFALIRLGSIQPDGDELERGGRLLGEIGDDRTALMAKRMFAANLVGKNKPEAAFRVAEEGLHLAERMGSLHDRGEFLRFQAAAHMLSDRLESADELFSEAIPLLQKSGDLRCSARSFAQHGVVLARLGRQEEARTAFANAWELASAVYDPSVLHLSLRGLLLISDDETAVALQAAAERIRQSADISVYPGLATDQHMTEVRSRLDPAVYLSAWERGTTLDPLEIVQEATAARPQRR
ncbi:MAG: ATP-binding protein, partial [Acidimicrobiia bacterium]